MSAGDDITIEVAPAFAAIVDTASLLATARATLAAEGVAAASLSLLVTGDETVRALNRQYRGIDEPTDVLSFGEGDAEAGEGEPWVVGEDSGERAYLGDIVIAMPYTERQAQRAQRPLADELAHLVTHGILHLLGHDHEEPGDERAMRARERAILGDRYREVT